MYDFLPLCVVILLVLAGAAHRRLMKAAQPLRLELACRGEALLKSKKLPLTMRPFVEDMLDTAFGSRGFLLFAILAIPFLALWIVLRPRSFAARLDEISIPDSDTSFEFRELMRLHDRITFANNPVLLFLVEIEVLLFIAPSILILSLWRGRVPKRAHREEILALIERREMRMFGRNKLA